MTKPKQSAMERAYRRRYGCECESVEKCEVPGAWDEWCSAWQAAAAHTREECELLALESRCERNTPWDLACMEIVAKIRKGGQGDG